MKQLFCNFFILLTMLLLICGCESNVITKIEKEPSSNVPATNDIHTEKVCSKAITLYEFDRETYYQMLKEPSITVAQECLQQHVYAITSREGWIEYTNNEQIESIEYEGAVYNSSGVYIDSSFIQFMTSEKMLGEFLSNNDITGEIENITGFYTRRMPLIIWVQTEYDECFITVNTQINSITLNADYEYYVYTTQEMYNDLKPIEGALIVNGREVLEKVIIHKDHAEIPFLFVLKTLGADITPSDEETIVIDYDTQQIALHTTDFSVWQGDKQNNVSMIPPGGYRFCRCEDGEVWVDHNSAARVLSLFSAVLKLDQENNAVLVTSVTE